MKWSVLRIPVPVAIGAMLLGYPMSSWAVDPTAAEDLAQASGCFKCHTVAKKKDGPAYRDVAAKYRDITAAEDKLIQHITSGEMVKFEDGHEEHHKKVKAKTVDQARNLVRWILAQPGGTKY
jgi:cytochrome c